MAKRDLSEPQFTYYDNTHNIATDINGNQVVLDKEGNKIANNAVFMLPTAIVTAKKYNQWERKDAIQKRIDTNYLLNRLARAQQHRDMLDKQAANMFYTTLGAGIGTLTGNTIPMITGAIGGNSIDIISNKYTGRTFGKNINKYSNNIISQEVGDFLNPGYYISGGIGKGSVNTINYLKKPTNRYKLYTKLGYIKDANNLIAPGHQFRIVGTPAITDAIESGLIRSKTGLHHASQKYLRDKYSNYLEKIKDWEYKEAGDLFDELNELGAFNNLSIKEKVIGPGIAIRNSTNHGNTVGFNSGRPYTSYKINKNDYIIEVPNSKDFVTGHHGSIWNKDNAGTAYGQPTLIYKNGTINNVSIPTEGSYYWKYNNLLKGFTRHKFK